MKDLVLLRVGSMRMNVTKLIREKLGLSLGQCTAMLKTTPVVVGSGLDDSFGSDLKIALEALGAEVRLDDISQKEDVFDGDENSNLGDLYKITVLRVESHSAEQGDCVSSTNGYLDGPEVKVSLFRGEQIAVYINGGVHWFPYEDEGEACKFVVDAVQAKIPLSEKEATILFQIAREGDDCDYKRFIPNTWDLSVGSDEISCNDPDQLTNLLAVNVTPYFNTSVHFTGEYADADEEFVDENLVMACISGAAEVPVSAGDVALLKEDVFNEEKNPDFISTPIKNLDPEVWDRGFYCTTADGVWYEVYVSETIKGYYPTIDLSDDDDFEAFGEFGDIFLDNYEQYRQITFFVPNNESTYTLEELTEILI